MAFSYTHTLSSSMYAVYVLVYTCLNRVILCMPYMSSSMHTLYITPACVSAGHFFVNIHVKACVRCPLTCVPYKSSHMRALHVLVYAVLVYACLVHACLIHACLIHFTRLRISRAFSSTTPPRSSRSPRAPGDSSPNSDANSKRKER